MFPLFFACKKEPVELMLYANVSPELNPYFQLFEIEAAKRGINIDLQASGIKGEIVNIHGDFVALCAKASGKRIIIDRKFWDTNDQYDRELIVFHELGHCYLNKTHNNQKEVNGNCASIMRNGSSGCTDFYTKKTRTDLLDDFFSN